MAISAINKNSKLRDGEQQMGRIIRRKYKFGDAVSDFGIWYGGGIYWCGVISSSVPGSLYSGVYENVPGRLEDLVMELAWDIDTDDGRMVDTVLSLGRQQGLVIKQAELYIRNAAGVMKNTYYDLAVKGYEQVGAGVGRCGVVFGVRAGRVERVVDGIEYGNE